MTHYSDIANLEEDDRIQMIGVLAEKSIRGIGFFVEDDAKADRYIAKLTSRFKVRVVTRTSFAKTIFVKVVSSILSN